MFYELVPHILRDPELRPRLSASCSTGTASSTPGPWARNRAPSTRPQLEPLALLTVAIADGVALQVQADPELDVGPPSRSGASSS